MVNTDICAEQRWKYEFKKGGGTWACSLGLRASVTAARDPQSQAELPASCLIPPPACSVTLATYVPSEHSSGLQTTLRANMEP